MSNLWDVHIIVHENLVQRSIGVIFIQILWDRKFHHLATLPRNLWLEGSRFTCVTSVASSSVSLCVCLIVSLWLTDWLAALTDELAGC